MSGLPIRDFDKLLSKLDAINQTWLAIYELLKPEQIIDNNEMEIPLKVKLALGTGNRLGEDTPKTIFQEMGSLWDSIISSTIDSNQNITGYKVAKLNSYQPGKEYTFNVQIDSNFTDFDSSKTVPIEVFLIDSSVALSAAIGVVAGALSVGEYNIGNYIPKFIGFMKSNGWIKNLPASGGAFIITPGNSHNLIHFCIHTSSGGGQGAVITSFNKETNTFILGGY